MYTGNMIDDLINSVECAEKNARERQNLEQQFHDYLFLPAQLHELEVA